jgi:hypothetical protein
VNFKHWFLNEEKKYTFEDAKKISKKAGLSISAYSRKEIVDGINTEKEHQADKKLDVIKGKEENILKIALAHLKEDPHYYAKLKRAGL